MKQSNGTVVAYAVKDMLHGRVFQVSIKGLDGVVKIDSTCYSKKLAAAAAGREWSNFTGFPLIEQGVEDVDYWLGVGVLHPKGRGQYRVRATCYIEAQAIAETAGLGMYPIVTIPFTSLPLLGVIES